MTVKKLKQTTRLGVLKLKNGNKNFFCLTSLIFLFTLIILIGCKTSSVQQEKKLVAPINLLDDEASMYIHIPIKNNKELCQNILLSYANTISEQDANMILSKIDDIYVSFGSRNDKRRFQISGKANIPSIVNSALKKNGFKKDTYIVKSLAEQELSALKSYDYFFNDNIQISFPNSNILCLSKNVKPMLDLYSLEYDFINKPLDNALEFEEVYRSDWKQTDLYKWIAEDVPDIHFYIVRPQAFLSNLLGADFSTRLFRLVYSKGSFTKLDNSKYELTLDLEFQDARYVRPAISALILSLGLTDSEIKIISPTHVQLTNVHLNVKQLANMLGI